MGYALGDDKAEAWGKDMMVRNSVDVDNYCKVEMEPIEVQEWKVLPHQQDQMWWQRPLQQFRAVASVTVGAVGAVGWFSPSCSSLVLDGNSRSES